MSNDVRNDTFKTFDAVRVGQIDEYKSLCGFGRKLRLCYNGGDIWEGQFQHNELNGFGRSLCIYSGGREHRMELGFYKAGFMHGYGIKIYSDGRVEEGLWEEDGLKGDKSEIKSYNPNLHKIAQKIDVDKYLFEDCMEVTKYKLNSTPMPFDNTSVR